MTAFTDSCWFDFSGRSESSDLCLTPEMIEAEFGLSERSSATSVKEDQDEGNGLVQWVIKYNILAHWNLLNVFCFIKPSIRKHLLPYCVVSEKQYVS